MSHHVAAPQPTGHHTGKGPNLRSIAPRTAALLLLCACASIAQAQHGQTKGADTYTSVSLEDQKRELPIHQIPNIGGGAEFYFSPDSKSLIGNLKREGDATHQVYTFSIDGTNIRRINDKGADACSFFHPDGKHLLWTSTRDHLDLPPGEWSTPWDYPQGAELYLSDLDGGNIQRLTNNNVYDAEVTASPDGKYIVFGRQTNGKMDLWRSLLGGKEEFQVTHLDGWEPGGVQYIPGTRKLLFRAWPTEAQVAKSKQANSHAPLPMTIFTINDDGTDLKRLTHDDKTNWAPYPAPDGIHYAFAQVVGGRNYEVFLGEYDSDKQTRLTFNDAFDGFPSFSPDGKWLQISSSRASKPGERFITAFLLDVSSLNLGPRK